MLPLKYLTIEMPSTILKSLIFLGNIEQYLVYVLDELRNSHIELRSRRNSYGDIAEY